MFGIAIQAKLVGGNSYRQHYLGCFFGWKMGNNLSTWLNGGWVEWENLTRWHTHTPSPFGKFNKKIIQFGKWCCPFAGKTCCSCQLHEDDVAENERQIATKCRAAGFGQPAFFLSLSAYEAIIHRIEAKYKIVSYKQHHIILWAVFDWDVKSPRSQRWEFAEIEMCVSSCMLTVEEVEGVRWRRRRSVSSCMMTVEEEEGVRWECWLILQEERADTDPSQPGGGGRLFGGKVWGRDWSGKTRGGGDCQTELLPPTIGSRLSWYMRLGPFCQLLTRIWDQL